MQSNSKIRFAVLGAGHIGKRHAAMITNNPECELVAMADIRNREDLGIGEYEVPFFRSADELLAGSLLFDVLCVATPNGLHEEHAVKGLHAGKHVVIEKPMALSKAGCENIIAASISQAREVFCVMQNRYSPPSAWLKEVVTQGKLGKIYMVQVNCYWNRDERYYKKGTWHGTKELDGGVLFTQFSHFIDILYWLFGDIEDIRARFENFNHGQMTGLSVDSGMVNFRFSEGGIGCINFSTSVWDENLESSITIIAEKGTIKVGGQYMNEVRHCHISGYTMPVLAESSPANNYGHYKGSAANHHHIFDNVVDVLGAGAASPPMHAKE